MLVTTFWMGVAASLVATALAGFARGFPGLLVRLAGLFVPDEHRNRWREEWFAEARSAGFLERVQFALGLLRAGWRIARAERAQGGSDREEEAAAESSPKGEAVASGSVRVTLESGDTLELTRTILWEHRNRRVQGLQNGLASEEVGKYLDQLLRSQSLTEDDREQLQRDITQQTWTRDGEDP